MKTHAAIIVGLSLIALAITGCNSPEKNQLQDDRVQILDGIPIHINNATGSFWVVGMDDNEIKQHGVVTLTKDSDTVLVDYVFKLDMKNYDGFEHIIAENTFYPGIHFSIYSGGLIAQSNKDFSIEENGPGVIVVDIADFPSTIAEYSRVVAKHLGRQNSEYNWAKVQYSYEGSQEFLTQK
jgi:hypothetical protein